MLETLQLIDMSSLTQIIIAIIAIFGGSGYWAWKIKKFEANSKSNDSGNKEFKAALLLQVTDLMNKIEELQQIKGELLEQIYQLKADLREARNEVAALQAILRHKSKEE